MYSVKTAYLLWLASFFGAAGLHRLYMGKIGSGVLYLLTWGLFGLGTIYDGITMADQVREAKLKSRIRRELTDDPDDLDDLDFPRRALPAASSPHRESVEHVILRVAKANHGVASPAEIALEGNIPTDEARNHLDDLVNKGIAEVRVRKSGALVYVFPDFLDETGSADLEQY